jgi:hypothetical protein
MVKHPTFNIQHSTPMVRHLWAFDVRCSMFDVFFFWACLCAASLAIAQPQPPPQPPQLDPLLQLMVTQPSIEVASNIQVTAVFDPPMVRPGEKAIYRVTFNALTDSILWPEKIAVPPQLQMRFSARGQTLVPVESKLKPQTTINYHVRGADAGSFTIPEFAVQVYGHRVLVPAAQLEVTPQAANSSPQSLQIQLTETNLYVGQPVKVRVQMRASASNVIQGIQDMRFNGEGFLVDQGTARQMINMIAVNGGNVAAYQYETMLTPLVTGSLAVSAQGFTAGNRFSGTIVIQGQAVIPGGAPQYVLVDSDPVTIQVRALPRASELPGFTGAIGNLTMDPPQLSTNQTRVGELVKLTITVRGDGNLARLVPPSPPAHTNWQVFPAVPGGASIPPGAAPALPGSFATFTYSLIPLATNVNATPAIPFSYFDTKRAAYVNLTVPPAPIRVAPGTVPADARLLMETETESSEEKKLKLSDLAVSPGRTMTNLVPLQLRGWFLLVQILPVVGFVGLWRWDRRRRFLEQHPEIILRRRARRELRRQRRQLQQALTGGDETRYAAVAVSAMRVAVAPHYPAEPRALVGRDVLEVLGENGNHKELVRRFFSTADASQFSGKASGAAGLIALQPELDRVLNELETKL